MKSDYFTRLFKLYELLKDDIPPTLRDLIFQLFPIEDHSHHLHEQYCREDKNA